MIAQKKPRVMPGRRKFLKAAVSGAGVAALLPRVVTSAVQAGYPNLAHLRAQHENAGIISPQKTYRMMEWEAHTPPLVLPEVEVLSDEQAEVIRNWVKGGGRLLASYKCGLLDEKRKARSNFPLADVLGVDYESEERKYVHEGGEVPPRPGAYTSTCLESSGSPLAKMLAASTVGLPGSFLRVKRTTAEEVMRYRLPFMVEDMPHHHWFNWGPPPPGTETAGTAVAYNRFGKGQSLYLGVPIFWAMQSRPFWIRAWVPELMRQLVKEPIADLRPEPLTEYLHGTFFYDKSGEHILVQVLNTVEAAMEGEYRGIPKVRIGVDGRRLKVTRARMVWPKEEELEVHHRGARTEVVLQNPPHYTALFLKLATA